MTSGGAAVGDVAGAGSGGGPAVGEAPAGPGAGCGPAGGWAAAEVGSAVGPGVGAGGGAAQAGTASRRLIVKMVLITRASLCGMDLRITVWFGASAKSPLKCPAPGSGRGKLASTTDGAPRVSPPCATD